MYSTTELSQLQKLQEDLNAINSTQRSLDKAHQKKAKLQQSCYQNIVVESALDTNNTNTYDSKIRKAKKTKKKIAKFSVITLAILVFFALLNSFLVKFDYVGNTYLYTPEIVKSYTRMFVTSEWKNSKVTYEIITITSCSETGKIEGNYEKRENDYNYKTTFKAKIKGKSEDNKYIKLQLDVFDDSGLPETMIIYNDYNTLKTSKYSFQAVNSTFNTDSLATPEIVRTYKGTYALGVYHDGSITFTSCDERGAVKGYFEIKEKNNYGKYAISGQITEKNENGHVKLMLNPGEWIKKSDYSKIDGTIVDIYTQVQCLTCSTYDIYWLDASINVEDLYAGNEEADKDKLAAEMAELENVEFLKRIPLTEEQQNERNIMLLSFLIVPVVALVILFVLKKVLDESVYTKREKAKIEEMMALDEANRKENENRRNQLIEEKKRAVSGPIKEYEDKISTLKKELENLEKEVAENDILSNPDKKIKTVDYLVNLIESRRADSVKEALLRMDEDKRREEEETRRREEQKRREEEEFQRKLIELENKSRLEAFDRKWQARQEAEDYLNQMFERQKMKKAIDDQTYELKRIRKELEDRR